ncbi:Acetylxylan esterase precursor [Clostridium liquoris]|uniref:Acetylxylan esterase n=1 Tax=Clostridium liquoris TaxID=1289519 RepID=A0A2T0B2I6_9CLOT|nr:alpha/beta hydrolase [Clostridium liquoris]PRR78110.1 Acetylxylan esterase precursor [Clostridium liquoris]
MKKVFKSLKIFLLLIFIVISCFAFIYKDKIKLYINIGEKYVNLQKDTSSIPKVNNSRNMKASDFETIVYKNTNNVPLTLDIYKAKKQLSKGSPVILYVHGGSWIYGDKNIPSVLSPPLDSFREEGFTIISVEYRLMKPGVSFDRPTSDVKDAIRWVYKNKDVYNFNSNEIGVLGISSGAHLSLLASYTDDKQFMDDKNLENYPSKVKYLIDFLGPTDLSTLDTSKANWDMNNILKSVPNVKELTSKYSPISYVHNGAPKTLMIYSKNDTLVPYKNGVELYNKCKENNVFAKLIPLENCNHDLSGLSKEDMLTLSKEVLKFILQNSSI